MSSHRAAVPGSMGMQALIELAPEHSNIIPYDRLPDRRECKVLGRGQFGEVLSGPYDGKDVAIKFIYKRDVFEHENIVLCQIRHANLVQYIGHGSCGHDYYILTELVGGGNLREYLDSRKADPLASTAICSIALQLANAINYLHNYRVPIIHRDVKSPNILIAAATPAATAPMIKLADVGIAHTASTAGTILTTIGTPLYMSPEAMGSSPHSILTYGTKADVYGFSMVLWELLTRERLEAGYVRADGVSRPPTEIEIILDLVRIKEPRGVGYLQRLFKWCNEFHPDNRPSMDIVVAGLEGAALLPAETDDLKLFRPVRVMDGDEAAVQYVLDNVFREEERGFDEFVGTLQPTILQKTKNGDLQVNLQKTLRAHYERQTNRVALRIVRLMRAQGLSSNPASRTPSFPVSSAEGLPPAPDISEPISCLHLPGCDAIDAADALSENSLGTPRADAMSRASSITPTADGPASKLPD
eukprot:m.6301 g.6301  ORF g.6301 m.6301 type:complete len:472 (-) comp2085_c0_seq1:293-1708(-)